MIIFQSNGAWWKDCMDTQIHDMSRGSNNAIASEVGGYTLQSLGI